MSDLQNLVGKCVGVEVGKASMTAVCVDADGAIVGEQIGEVSFAETSSSQLIYFISSLKASFGAFARVGVAVPAINTQKNPQGPNSPLCAIVPDSSSVISPSTVHNANTA